MATLKNKKKQYLRIVTDDTEKAKSDYDDIFSNLNYCNKLSYVDISDVLLCENEKTLSIMLIYNIASLSHRCLINICKSIEKGFFFFVYTNDEEEMKSCYTGITDKMMGKYYYNIDKSNYFETKAMIEKELGPQIINLAFITNNTRFKDIFSDLKMETTQRPDIDKDSISSWDTNLFVGPYLARVIQCWTYDLWYGKKKSKPDAGYCDIAQTLPGIMIHNIYSIKNKDGNIFNYLIIDVATNADLNLNAILEICDTIYLDLRVEYNLISPNNITEEMRERIIPFISYIDGIGTDIPITINVIRNKMIVDGGLGIIETEGQYGLNNSIKMYFNKFTDCYFNIITGIEPFKTEEPILIEADIDSNEGKKD